MNERRDVRNNSFHSKSFLLFVSLFMHSQLSSV